MEGRVIKDGGREVEREKKRKKTSEKKKVGGLPGCAGPLMKQLGRRWSRDDCFIKLSHHPAPALC